MTKKKNPDAVAPETQDQKDDKSPKMLKRAAEIFADHRVDEVFFTSDNTAFLHPQHARIHSENLKDGIVITVNRKEV